MLGGMAGNPNIYTTIKIGTLGHFNPVAPADQPTAKVRIPVAK